MRAPVPSRRQVSVLAWIVVAAVVALVLWMLATLARVGDEYDRLEQRADRGKDDRADLRALVEEQDAALGEANQRLRELGVAPVKPPTTPPSTPLATRGPMGPQGPQGDRGPTGKDGADGDDGRSIAGDRGADGAPGPTGPAGPAGPVGSQGPQGEAGPAGKDGKDGAPGPAGSITPGTYACDTGYVVGFTVAADGSVTLDCAVLP